MTVGNPLLSNISIMAALITLMLAQHTTQGRHTLREIAAEKLFAGVVGRRKVDGTFGIREVKQYLHQFGYLDNSFSHHHDLAAPVTIDQRLETALKVYQENHHLEPTGILDAETAQLMSTPRCGAPDIINGSNYMKHGGGSSANLHYAFFPGMPRWPLTQTHLTYAFVSDDPRNSMLRDTVRRAFGKWAGVSQFTFEEASGGASDITIGFYRGDHGDGHPFDGPYGVVGHAFPPTNGQMHLDGDERWSTLPGREEMDLESVCLHEIGHLLGLGHTSALGAVMAPSIPRGTVLRELQGDDIFGIRALYVM